MRGGPTGFPEYKFVQTEFRVHFQKLPRREKSMLDLVLVVTTPTGELRMDSHAEIFLAAGCLKISAIFRR